MDNKVKDAIQILVEALKTDESCRIGWQANIAMAFKDEFYRINPELKNTSSYELHLIANKAADNFLDLLCNDTQTNIQN